MKLELARHIFQKYSGVKFKDNPSMVGGGGGGFLIGLGGREGGGGGES